MDLQELMRIGSLTMNFLQSDHFKQLMGLMGQMGGTGFGQPNSGGNDPNPGQSQSPEATQPNFLGMDHFFANPLSSMFGPKKNGQQTRPFPFNNQVLPPWMQQRQNVHPFMNHPMINGQKNKRPSSLDMFMNFFSPKQKQQTQTMQHWGNPFVGQGPISQAPGGSMASYTNRSRSSREQTTNGIRSEKNRIRIIDANQNAKPRKRSKNR